MHMADALVSPIVGIVMNSISLGCISYSAVKIKKNDADAKFPLMGVMGAFIFAAQMVNFTIPGTGSSGHIGGGILLAATLGPLPGFLVMSAVLLIQALFFGDGGLLTLGCNVFNLGFYSCFVAYPLIFKPIVKNHFNTKRIAIASILSAIIGLQLGAFSVVMETLASGITNLPFSAFLVLMQPIHLAIGLVEGIVTAFVLCFVNQIRPELLENKKEHNANKNNKRLIIIFLISAIIISAGISQLASSKPDGLEWSISSIIKMEEIKNSNPISEFLRNLQEKTAIMPDYNFKTQKDEVTRYGTSIAGILGGGITLLFSAIIGYIIYFTKKHKRKIKDCDKVN